MRRDTRTWAESFRRDWSTATTLWAKMKMQPVSLLGSSRYAFKPSEQPSRSCNVLQLLRVPQNDDVEVAL